MAGALAYIMLCLFLHYGRIWGYHTHEDSHSTLDRYIPTTKLLDKHSSLQLVTQMGGQTDKFLLWHLLFLSYYSVRPPTPLRPSASLT
jgi:hypothetical protein